MGEPSRKLSKQARLLLEGARELGSQLSRAEVGQLLTRRGKFPGLSDTSSVAEMWSAYDVGRLPPDPLDELRGRVHLFLLPRYQGVRVYLTCPARLHGPEACHTCPAELLGPCFLDNEDLIEEGESQLPMDMRQKTLIATRAAKRGWTSARTLEFNEEQLLKLEALIAADQLPQADAPTAEAFRAAGKEGAWPLLEKTLAANAPASEPATAQEPVGGEAVQEPAGDGAASQEPAAGEEPAGLSEPPQGDGALAAEKPKKQRKAPVAPTVDLSQVHAVLNGLNETLQHLSGAAAAAVAAAERAEVNSAAVLAKYQKAVDIQLYLGDKVTSLCGLLSPEDAQTIREQWAAVSLPFTAVNGVENLEDLSDEDLQALASRGGASSIILTSRSTMLAFLRAR